MSVETTGMESAAVLPPHPSAGGNNKPPKTSRRKISLPWFRQSSFGERLTKLRLPRQHTVDCGSTVTRNCETKFDSFLTKQSFHDSYTVFAFSLNHFSFFDHGKKTK